MNSVRNHLRGLTSIVLCFALCLGTTAAAAALPGDEHGEQPGLQISSENWGRVTAPVFGASEKGVYAGAELFAGPNKFGSYFSGVLPNGRIVTPAGVSIQIGMNPLGAAITPDGRFLVTSNDDERDGGIASLRSATNVGGYSLSVIDTSTMTVVSQITTGKFFVGMQITGAAPGPYTLWAAGGAEQDVKRYTLAANGAIAAATPAHIVISPILPPNAGYVSNYTPDVAFNTADASGNKPPVPTGFSRTVSPINTQLTFPAGLALSPDQKYLYVACNGDNSVAVIDTTTNPPAVVQRVPVGYFPYNISVSGDGQHVLVSDWGITEYKFSSPHYSGSTLVALDPTSPPNAPGFFVPVTSTSGPNPKTSSISILSAPGGDGAMLSLQGAIYEGHPLDDLNNVGDTHPSATAIVRHGSTEVLYVTKSNSDAIGMIRLDKNQKLPDFQLSAISIREEKKPGEPGTEVHGAYPNALAVSPGGDRVYVAEAGLNSVAVLDTTDAVHPRLLGRIPTGWYPTSVTLGPDGHTLYVVNAKGIGEDINPNTNRLASFSLSSSIGTGQTCPLCTYTSIMDSNYIFGTVQKVDLTVLRLHKFDVLGNNFAVQPQPKDTSIVPVGGAPSKKIKHVFFILHENKTFDSMLGNLGAHFGGFASTQFNQRDGTAYTDGQYTGVSLNTQKLAQMFATAVNYYSDSEESDAGHQFSASGTATDYTEKTLLVKSGRGLLVNKNFEPEDYPESGYIFNNAARNGVSFKDYGALIRIVGTDTGTSTPTTINDPPSGQAGLPRMQTNQFNVTDPLVTDGDTTAATSGLGQSYFMSMPILAILGGHNHNGEARLDRDYPGYNFNISDQRRAKEFIKDFDRMVENGTLPQFVYIYQPNDHTGGIQAPNGSINTTSSTGLQLVADGDVGLGMVVKHIMESPVYYNHRTGEGSAIFITYDDAQSSLDHIHPHRTPLIVVSPYAKPGYLGKRHYVTASVVKTEELLLGLPPNNLGDLFATDLRDLFQSHYNAIDAADFKVQASSYSPTREGRRIWSLVAKLDTSAPDRDSRRLGALLRLTLAADNLHRAAATSHRLGTRTYRDQQATLYRNAFKLVNAPAPRDLDD
jgi:YVTN family beta-propeller protein